MLNNLLSPNRLRVERFDFGEEELARDRRQLRRLLGAIVNQAMDDGMLRIRIGVDRASGEPFMKYFGPVHYDPDKQIWWDMVPPPSEHYPVMIQVCMSLAELDQGLPIKGVIPAIKQRKRLRLTLTVNEIESFQLAWDAVHALDRAESETYFPEDAQTDDRRGEGDAAQPA